MKYARILFASLVALIFLSGTASAQQDPGWPRKLGKPGGTVLLYQPQVDDWQGFTDIKWRSAFQLTPNGGKQVVGAASFEATTEVDTDNHTVFLFNIQILNTYFPSLDPASSAQMDQLFRTFVPLTLNASLDRLVADMPKSQSVKTVELQNDPPYIFVSYSPAVLLSVDGEPVLADVSGAKLKFVVNTTWPLFLEPSEAKYYLLVGNIWLTAADLHGPWSQTIKLSREFKKIPDSGKFAPVKKAVPPPQVPNPIIPAVFYSTVPAEVILFDGQPSYSPITGTELSYANNTDSPVFVYSATQTYYYLAAGRWFSAANLAGPWTFATPNLPGDFANIPLSSPASAVLASVPGTSEAKDAVLIAQIPTTMILNPTTAAAQANVVYTGTPQFAPIQGTTLQYATNTPDKVVQVGDVYYLCLQGVWFMSTTPQGPWTTAGSVPQVIYSIPPSSPIYNVTYVTQTTTSDGNIQASYTAGYLGAFVMGAAVGAIVCSGSGYYYPPYIGYPAYGYPVYHPYATAYGATPYYTSHGAYGYSQTAYGAYGSATRAAQYNPYTGTYARGASTSTAYGKQSVGQAYNPYTGTYGATHQGSSPTAQWGQSYVQQGNKSAYTQHYSTANGTVASAQGSQGGKAYASSSAFGNTYAGKNSSGDMYAGHDGNVYQNSGSGWQKYNNSTSSWNNVNTQQAQQDKQNYQQEHPDSQGSAQQREQSFNQEKSSGGWSTKNLNSEMQSRQSGAAQSDHYQNYQHSGGGWGGSHSFGGWGGGGRSWGGGGDRSWGGGGWRR
jgi:hypothetical protein